MWRTSVHSVSKWRLGRSSQPSTAISTLLRNCRLRGILVNIFTKFGPVSYLTRTSRVNWLVTITKKSWLNLLVKTVFTRKASKCVSATLNPLQLPASWLKMLSKVHSMPSPLPSSISLLSIIPSKSLLALSLSPSVAKHSLMPIPTQPLPTAIMSITNTRWDRAINLLNNIGKTLIRVNGIRAKCLHFWRNPTTIKWNRILKRLSLSRSCPLT